MRLRVFFLAAATALAIPSAAAARPADRSSYRHASEASIVGTWSSQVTPQGQAATPPFQALITFTRDHGVVETESDHPGTGLGSWQRVGPNRYAFAFEIFVLTPTGTPGGWVVVNSIQTVTRRTLSGPYTFKIFNPAGTVVASGGGTATATRFVIPPF
jgi:hypothetical protein